MTKGFGVLYPPRHRTLTPSFIYKANKNAARFIFGSWNRPNKPNLLILVPCRENLFATVIF